MMTHIESLLEDPDVRLIVAEGNLGLFVAIRFSADEEVNAMRSIQSRGPHIKWVCLFRKETTAKAAADAFFEELRQRQIELPVSCEWLIEEVS